MKSSRWIRGFVLSAAVVGICIPQPVLAGAPAALPSSVGDVALCEGGVLLGRVVNPEGIGKAGIPVAIVAGKQELAVSKTDADGYFAFRGLRGGVYQVASSDGQGVYRLWSPDTAPPSAEQGALVVTNEPVVRGQQCGQQCGQPGTQYSNNGMLPGMRYGGRLRFWLSNPWVLGGLVATAVAVPVIIIATDDDDDPHTPN